RDLHIRKLRASTAGRARRTLPSASRCDGCRLARRDGRPHSGQGHRGVPLGPLACSGRQPRATLGSAASEQATTTSGAHPNAEAVGLLAPPVVGLERLLHVGNPRSDRTVLIMLRRWPPSIRGAHIPSAGGTKPARGG